MKVLVAVDAGDAGERILKAIGPWAVASGVELHLLTVLTPGQVHETVRPHATHALTPAATSSGGLLHTHEPFPVQAENKSQAIERELQELQNHQRDLAAALPPGASCTFHSQIDAHVADAILAKAEALAADFIAMGTHGRTGLSHVLMGSVAESIVRRAKVPVLMVGPQALPPLP